MFSRQTFPVWTGLNVFALFRGYQYWLILFTFLIDDKDTLTMKTSNLKLMDMITMFNNKCKEKEASE